MSLQIPHPNTPLHLYRHLLREASYLPPLCQPYITNRIRTRFRDCRRPKRDPKVYIQHAHHDLRYLRSANAGHVERILRLCYMATGRVGKRRRELASAQLAKQPPANSSELNNSITSETPHAKGGHDWLDNWSIGMIKALAASQVQFQASDGPHQMRRNFDPEKVMPKVNAFGRPLTKKLARNKRKRHWAVILRQLLPPLPQGEWQQLGALAQGKADAKNYVRPKRRPVAQSNFVTADTTQWDWTEYITRPARSIERGSSRTMKTLTGHQDEDPRGHGRPIGIRVLGPRRCQRSIYGRIWGASPLVVKSGPSGKINITWGSVEQRISSPTKKDLQFFQGVDKAQDRRHRNNPRKRLLVDL
ncbi:hypothetical protein F4779DRAFT_494467 [Xylariaceae sp. FL0662B]|nr:hypothetical protein F4779DRAFT_494467 [Xylariaceae sp. FL0662B]